MGGLLARDLEGGAGRDTMGFGTVSGSKHGSLDSTTLTTASTSSVFGGLDGIGLPHHCVWDRCKRQRKDPACFVGAHRQVIFTGVVVDTIAFSNLVSETLADGDKDESHQRLISGSRCLWLYHCFQEFLVVYPPGKSWRKKNDPNTSTRSAASSQNAHRSRNQKNRRKKKCKATSKRIISLRHFFPAKPTPERKRTKSWKAPNRDRRRLVQLGSHNNNKSHAESQRSLQKTAATQIAMSIKHEVNQCREAWNEKIGGNNAGISERRKMIGNWWKKIEKMSKKDGKQPRTSPEQTAAEAQQVWNEEIGEKHAGISDRRKMIKNSDER